MNQTTHSKAVTVIFSLIAVLQGLRLILGWEAVIGGFIVPMWFSAVAVLVAGYLAYYGYKFSK